MAGITFVIIIAVDIIKELPRNDILGGIFLVLCTASSKITRYLVINLAKAVHSLPTGNYRAPWESQWETQEQRQSSKSV